MKASKKATAFALAGTLAVIGTCSMALFTDHETGTASATAGTLDLTLSQDWVNANDKYHLANKAAGTDGIIDPMLPGSKLEMDYTLANAGNKSMDIRETVVIKSADKTFNAEKPEFKLYKADDVELDTATGAYKAKDGKSPISFVLTDANTITISPATMTLSGTGANAEVETGFEKTSYTGDYVILFEASAANSWMGKELTIDYLAEAKQHRNTGGKDAWDTIVTETISLTSGTAVNAVAPLN